MLVPCEVRHMNGLATGNYSRSVSKVPAREFTWS